MYIENLISQKQFQPKSETIQCYSKNQLLYSAFIFTLPMNTQKNSRVMIKSNSAHSLRLSKPSKKAKYGPPPIKKILINDLLGYNLKKMPLGLKKHLRSESYSSFKEYKQSYFDLALRSGELNFWKRFKNIRYLQNFSSKKALYNICQQSIISSLQNKIVKLKHEGKLIKSRKQSEIQF